MPGSSSSFTSASARPASRFPSWLRPALVAAAVVVILFLGLGLRHVISLSADWLIAVETPDGQLDVQVYQVDPDCYTRLARVQRILAGDGPVLRWHGYENFPEGIAPTTTFPMDAAILAVYPLCTTFSDRPLDWAGAITPPILYAALALYLWFWSRPLLRLPSRLVLQVGAAAAVGIAWATSFGRPDHQSLILLLVTIGWTAEWRRWDSPGRSWAVAAGLAWGFALWTSLFEPLLMAVCLVVGNLALRRREQPAMLIALAAVLAAYLLVEGLRVAAPPAEYQPHLFRWFEQIGELQSAGVVQLNLLMSPALWLMPIAIFRLYQRANVRPEHHLTLIVALLLLILTAIQLRWFSYSTMFLLLLFVLWFDREPNPWLRSGLALLAAASLVWANNANLAPPPSRATPINADLRRIAAHIQRDGAILAPWWQSPALLYYSGQPIVASSSHVAIPGIVDTSRFFVTNSWSEADEILTRHGARWVVVWRPDLLLPKSRQILGVPPPATESQPLLELPLAHRLFLNRAIPTRYKLRVATDDFRLFEYEPGG